VHPENTPIPPAWKTARSGARSLVVYLALVGLPLAGLSGVLRVGAKLTAPWVVGGAYRLSEGNERCLGLSSDESLRVEQSGRYLRISAGRASASAILEHERIHAVLTPVAGPCRGQRVVLEARVASATTDLSAPAHLTGVLEAQACVPCASASFHAQRISK